jgi:hypothetical protein
MIDNQALSEAPLVSILSMGIFGLSSSVLIEMTNIPAANAVSATIETIKIFFTVFPPI